MRRWAVAAWRWVLREAGEEREEEGKYWVGEEGVRRSERSSEAIPSEASEAMAGAPRIWRAELPLAWGPTCQNSEGRRRVAAAAAQRKVRRVPVSHLHRLDRVERAVDRVDLLPRDDMRQLELVNDLDRLGLEEGLAAGDAECRERLGHCARGRGGEGREGQRATRNQTSACLDTRWAGLTFWICSG